MMRKSAEALIFKQVTAKHLIKQNPRPCDGVFVCYGANGNNRQHMVIWTS